MRIGVLADSHDHVDHMRLAVQALNAAECETVLFAGDFVSPIVIPPLRKLKASRFLACYGDNEGNRPGIEGGLRVVGPVAEPPFGFTTKEGLRILVTHIPRVLEGFEDEADVIVSAHTHRPRIWTDDAGRLRVNPGETSGWTFRSPSVAIIETDPLSARIVELLPDDHPFRTKPV